MRAKLSDNDAPTRPHPITTTRTCRSLSINPRTTNATAFLPPVAGGLTLGTRVQAFDRRAAAGTGPAVSQRHAFAHPIAETDRPPGLRLRRAVLGGLRARG